MDWTISKKELPGLIDISVLSAQSTVEEVEQLAVAANEYRFIAAFVLPSYIPVLKQALGETTVKLGAPVGFPTGADLTQDKVFQVHEMKKLGCAEFDMVVNIGMLKSAKRDYVRREIAEVVEAADGFPVKVILEVTYLTDDEIATGCEIVAESGAEYVKTGTGYSPKPTELRHVQLMKRVVGDSVKIKVAGGVRNLEMLKAFYGAGASRFGIGMRSALEIVRTAGEL